MYNKDDEVVECSEYKGGDEWEEEFVNSDDAKVKVCYVEDDGGEEEEEGEDMEEGEDVFGKMILEGKREIITQFNILKEKMINSNKHDNKNSSDNNGNGSDVNINGSKGYYNEDKNKKYYNQKQYMYNNFIKKQNYVTIKNHIDRKGLWRIVNESKPGIVKVIDTTKFTITV